MYIKKIDSTFKNPVCHCTINQQNEQTDLHLLCTYSQNITRFST